MNFFMVTQKWQIYNSKLVYVLSLQKGGIEMTEMSKVNSATSQFFVGLNSPVLC